MSPAFRVRLAPIAAALIAVAGLPGSANAGWVIVKNDTGGVIVVQESTVSNGVVKRGKPIRLLPGESMKEFHATPVMKFEVFEGGTAGRPLYTATLVCKDEYQTFSLTSDGKVVSLVPRAAPLGSPPRK